MISIVSFSINMSHFYFIQIGFLLSNGKDTYTCGQSMQNACVTLDFLLGRFYNVSYGNNQTLSLVTDTNLVINKHLAASQNLSLHNGFVLCLLFLQ